MAMRRNIKPRGALRLNAESKVKYKDAHGVWLMSERGDTLRDAIGKTHSAITGSGAWAQNGYNFAASGNWVNTGICKEPNVWTQTAIVKFINLDGGAGTNWSIADVAASVAQGTHDRTMYLTWVSAGKATLDGYLYDGGGKYVSSSSLFSVGETHVLTIATDASKFVLYVDGVLEDTTAVSTGGYQGFVDPVFVIGSSTWAQFLKQQLQFLSFEYTYSEKRILDFHQDPWAVVRQPRISAYKAPAAAGSTLPALSEIHLSGGLQPIAGGLG